MRADGTYIRRAPLEGEEARSAQEILYQQAYDRAAGRE